jgi:hypothetical protein
MVVLFILHRGAIQNDTIIMEIKKLFPKNYENLKLIFFNILIEIFGNL